MERISLFMKRWYYVYVGTSVSRQGHPLCFDPIEIRESQETPFIQHQQARPKAQDPTDRDLMSPTPSSISTRHDLEARTLEPSVLGRIFICDEAYDQRASDVNDLRGSGVVVCACWRIDSLAVSPCFAIVGTGDGIDYEGAALEDGFENGDDGGVGDGGDAEHAVAGVGEVGAGDHGWGCGPY